jgi:hypothetical protein
VTEDPRDVAERARRVGGAKELNAALARHGWRHVKTGLEQAGSIVYYDLETVVERERDPVYTTRFRIPLHEILTNPLDEVFNDAIEAATGKKPAFSPFLLMAIVQHARKAPKA